MTYYSHEQIPLSQSPRSNGISLLAQISPSVCNLYVPDDRKEFSVLFGRGDLGHVIHLSDEKFENINILTCYLADFLCFDPIYHF